MGHAQSVEHRLRRATLADMIENRILDSAAVGNEDQQRKLIALRERDHSGAHAEQPGVLHEQRRTHAAEPGAASDRQGFLLMRGAHEPHDFFPLDLHENLAKPAVRHGNRQAEAEPAQRIDKFGRPVRSRHTLTRFHQFFSPEHLPHAAAVGSPADATCACGAAYRPATIVGEACPIVDPRALMQNETRGACMCNRDG